MPGFPTHVWRKCVLRLPITPAQKVVLIALAEYADYQTGLNAWPGRPRLADDCGVSESAVDRAVKAGKRHKVIEQTGRGQKGLNPAFRLVMPDVSASVVTHGPVQRVTTANVSASLVTHLPTHIPTPTNTRQRVTTDALSEPNEVGPVVTSPTPIAPTVGASVASDFSSTPDDLGDAPNLDELSKRREKRRNRAPGQSTWRETLDVKRGPCGKCGAPGEDGSPWHECPQGAKSNSYTI